MSAAAYCPGCKSRGPIRSVIGPGIFCVGCGNFLGNDLAAALALQPVARHPGAETARAEQDQQPSLPFTGAGGAR